MHTSKLAGLMLLALILLVACSLPSTPTAAPLATEASLPVSTPVPESLPFEGIWMSDGEVPELLIFTKNSMYRVQSDQASAAENYSREQFANVVSYDLANNHISLRTQWFRVNGTMRGFDAPNFNITYKIEEDTLQIGVGWDEEFATELEPLVYHRK